MTCDLDPVQRKADKQGLTGSRYPTRPELFFKYPTRPDPKIENDWVSKLVTPPDVAQFEIPVHVD